MRERAKTALEIGAKMVLPERPLRIKLLGDSITHGCGALSYKEDGDIICSEFDHRRNTQGYCWANLFAEYMKDVCGCEVVNNAVIGTGIQLPIKHFDELVEDEDDIVIIMYGANNRHEMFPPGGQPQHTREEFMRGFMEQVTVLREKLENAGKDYVFLSGPPASLRGDGSEIEIYPNSGANMIRHFHMWDINNMLMKDSLMKEYPFIPIYAKVISFFENRGADPRDYREWSKPHGGIHLNEAGSRLVCRLVLEGLGLSIPPLI